MTENYLPLRSNGIQAVNINFLPHSLKITRRQIVFWFTLIISRIFLEFSGRTPLQYYDLRLIPMEMALFNNFIDFTICVIAMGLLVLTLGLIQKHPEMVQGRVFVFVKVEKV